MHMMIGKVTVFAALFIVTINGVAHGATARNATTGASNASPIAAYKYNYMYPYMNNQMRTDLNPGVTPSQSSNPINVITRTDQLAAPRRVVPRQTARAATNGISQSPAYTGTTGIPTNSTTRRVVPRTATQSRSVARATRADDMQTYPTHGTVSQAARNTGTRVTTTGEAISGARCLADYTECMNGYCQRENTAYNRCYCSSKLAQIDSQYQPEIDQLIQNILRLRNTNKWSEEEMNEYWMSTVGKYRGGNSWDNLDNALNIDWAGTESRVRGQQAFATGHDYCVQHLKACAYMASNLRDAYRSEISRDCATYESNLVKIKNAAESIVEMYSE